MQSVILQINCSQLLGPVRNKESIILRRFLHCVADVCTFNIYNSLERKVLIVAEGSRCSTGVMIQSLGSVVNLWNRRNPLQSWQIDGLLSKAAFNFK